MLGALTLLPRLTVRALDDLHEIARLAGRVPGQLDALLERADEATVLLGRIERLGSELAGLGERIDARAQSILELGDRIDARGDALVAVADRMDALAASLLRQGASIEEAARQVAVRGGEVARALPALERAVELAEPLEGVVERVGRLADRLPRGGRRWPERSSSTAERPPGPPDPGLHEH